MQGGFTTKDMIVVGGLVVLGGLLYFGVRKIAGALPSGSQVAGALNYVNPASPNNIINRGVNTVVETVTGRPGETLGTWIYDLFHPEEAAGSPDPYVAGGGEHLRIASGLGTPAEREAFRAGIDYIGESADAIDEEDRAQGYYMGQSSGAAYLDYSHLNPRRR